MEENRGFQKSKENEINGAGDEWEQISAIEGGRWYKPEDAIKAKEVLVGKVLCRSEKKTQMFRGQGPTHFYQLEILDTGEIVNVDERATLTMLASYIGRVVRIECCGKRQTKRGGTVWIFDVKVKADRA